MNALTTYIVTGKAVNFTWIFKFTANGNLAAFLIENYPITEKMYAWLCAGNFPYKEEMMEAAHWTKSVKVQKIPAQIDFDTFWEAYAKKQKRLVVKKIWDKMAETDRIKAFMGIKRYQDICRVNNRPPALADTYLNQRRWEDEY